MPRMTYQDIKSTYDATRSGKSHYSVPLASIPTYNQTKKFDELFFKTADIVKPDPIITKKANPQGREKIQGKYYKRNDYWAFYIYQQFPGFKPFKGENDVAMWTKKTLKERGGQTVDALECHLVFKATNDRAKSLLHGVTCYDLRIGCKGESEADEQCCWMFKYLSMRHGLKQKHFRCYRGGVDPVVAAWEFSFEEVVLPNLIYRNIKLPVITNLKIVDIPTGFHIDGVNHESQTQVKALNPRNIQLFKNFNCSIPEITGGFTGKRKFENCENNSGNLLVVETTLIFTKSAEPHTHFR